MNRFSLLSILVLFATFSPAAVAAAFSLNQTSVELFANAGGASVLDQSTALTNNNTTSLTISVSSSTNSGGNWLSASISPNPVPAKGTASITIRTDPSKLNPASYIGTVTVSGGGTTAQITVFLTVSGVTITASPNVINIGSLRLGTPQTTQVHITGSANVAISTSGGAWLSVNTTSVASPTNFNVTADPSTLTAGKSYAGTVTLQCVNGSPCVPVAIAVAVNVAAAPLVITTTSLPSGTIGSGYSASLGASGGITPYNWSVASGSLPPGLTLSPSGSISGTPTVVAQNTGFQFTVLVTDSTGNTAAKSLNIQVVGVPTLTVSPTLVSLSAQSGGGSAPQTLHVVVNTIDPIKVTAATSYQKGTGWLIAASSGGFDYTLFGNASGLLPDTYAATLTVSCVGQTCNQSPAQVRVNFSVTPASLQVSPSTLNFQVASGAISAAQSLSIASGGGQLSYSATADPWIIVNPPTGAVSTNPVSVSVSIDASTLSAGPHTGTIVISCGANCSSSSVSVSVNVTATKLTATPSSLSFQSTTPNGAIPRSQTVNINAPGVEGFSFAYSPQGSWLAVTSNQTSTPAVLTASIVSIPAQTSTGSITITPLNGTGAITVPVTLTVSASTSPSISPNGIVTASDFGGFSTIAPGTYIEIYGSNLSSTNPGRTWGGGDFTNNGQNAPTSLDGTRVTISGHDAFVEYVSPTHLNVLVPSDVGTGPAQLTVINPAGTSNSYAVTVNPVQPGLLAPPFLNINGKQYVAALFPDGQTFALPDGAVPGLPSRPAKPGDTVVIYGVGLGPVNPSIPAGTIVSQANTLAMPLQMLFGSTPATVAYDGLASSFTGLYQLNIQIPQVPDSDAVPLTLNLGGVNGTQVLYIAVHQ